METQSFRKSMLIRILEQLQGYWSLAKGFLELTQQTDDETFITTLYQKIRATIANIQDRQEKERVQHQLKKMYAQQRSEAALMQQDQKEAEQLLDSLFLNI